MALTNQLELRFKTEWNPYEHHPYTVYWMQKPAWIRFMNMPNAEVLAEMQDFCRSSGIDIVKHVEFLWPKTSRERQMNAGFRFLRHEDALMFWLRFNCVENEDLSPF